MKIYLIRHSITKGNLKKKYLGTTDEPLCEEGLKLLEKKKEHFKHRNVDIVFSSPMKRCMQTAQILYPNYHLNIIPELSECDFGLFENKNYEEMSDWPEYQKWIDSNGKDPFPGGESIEGFFDRSVKGFEKGLDICRKQEATSAAFVVHGGTIMGLLDRYVNDKEDHYNYLVENAGGYELHLEGKQVKNIEKI